MGLACAKTGWNVYAYVLLLNHFHAVIGTPNANLVTGMKWFLGTYTMAFNRRHKATGHLFSGRYKSLVVDSSNPDDLQNICDYVHTNTFRIGLEPAEAVRFPWSSSAEYLKPAGERLPWLNTGPLLQAMGLKEGEHQSVFQKNLETRAAQAKPEEWKKIRRGWCLGSDSFRKALLLKMAGQLTAHHYSDVRQESSELKARAILEEELRKLGWTQIDLEGTAKSHPEKLRIARRLRQETTMTLKWVAEHLEMGTWTYLACQLSASTPKPSPRKAEPTNPMWDTEDEKPAILWD